MGVGGWSPGAVFGLSAAKGASLVPVPAKSNVPLATHGTDIIFVIRRITKDVAHGCEICAEASGPIRKRHRGLCSRPDRSPRPGAWHSRESEGRGDAASPPNLYRLRDRKRVVRGKS